MSASSLWAGERAANDCRRDGIDDRNRCALAIGASTAVLREPARRMAGRVHG